MKCHAGLVILNGRASEDQPANPSVSQDVIGRYRGSGVNRFNRWFFVVSAVAWAVMGTAQFVEAHELQGVVFAAAWTALAVWAWVVPNTVISDQGVRLAGRRIIPWSQVVDIVVRPSRQGEKKNPPELVLREGIRRPIDLDADQVDGLRSLARKSGAPIPP